jgi:hypothetical protein
MLPTPIPRHLEGVSKKELETIFYQARAHDSCFACIALLQQFFDLYPPSQPLRFRTSAGEDFITTVEHRAILEWDFHMPKVISASVVSSEVADQGRTCIYTSGSDDVMRHAVMGFGRPGEKNVHVVMDLSSMQFGDVGRGLGGRSIFVLETLEA